MLLQSFLIAWVTPVTQALDLNSLSRVLFPLTQESQGMPGKREERVSVLRGSRVKLEQLAHHTPRGKYPRERLPYVKVRMLLVSLLFPLDWFSLRVYPRV